MTVFEKFEKRAIEKKLLLGERTKKKSFFIYNLESEKKVNGPIDVEKILELIWLAGKDFPVSGIHTSFLNLVANLNELVDSSKKVEWQNIDKKSSKEISLKSYLRLMKKNDVKDEFLFMFD